MTVRRPDQFATDVANAHQALDRLVEQYGWAYHYALSAGRGDGQGSGQIAYVDPAGETVADRHRLKVRELLERVTHHAQQLAAERVKLDRMIGREDEMRPRDNPPRSVSDSELEQAREAKRRREIRSERYGS